jgi:putative membrane protein insertion efficiency factor
MSEIAILPIRFYQRFMSPLLPRSCRYEPSCSQYAVDALRTYGVMRGTVLAGWRLLRCNPFSYGGYDPVERQTLFKARGGPGGWASPAAGATAGTGSAHRPDGGDE